jgi:hypothetical protein
MARPGVLSASIALGFPYADVPQLGSTVWVVTDDDPAAARRYADELSAYLVTHRHEFKHGLIEPEDAVREIAQTEERVCLLDVGDNAGGGGPADGTLLPQLLHDHGVERSLVLLYDPEAQQEALVTLGFFMVLINAFLLYLVSGIVKGFLVSGFWPAVGGAILISIVSGILNLWISEQGRIEIVTRSQTGRKIRHIN